MASSEYDSIGSSQLPLDVLALMVRDSHHTSLQPRTLMVKPISRVRFWSPMSPLMVLPFLEINTDHLLQYILLHPIAFQDSSVALH